MLSHRQWQHYITLSHTTAWRGSSRNLCKEILRMSRGHDHKFTCKLVPQLRDMHFNMLQAANSRRSEPPRQSGPGSSMFSGMNPLRFVDDQPVVQPLRQSRSRYLQRHSKHRRRRQSWDLRLEKSAFVFFTCFLHATYTISNGLKGCRHLPLLARLQYK